MNLIHYRCHCSHDREAQSGQENSAPVARRRVLLLGLFLLIMGLAPWFSYGQCPNDNVLVGTGFADLITSTTSTVTNQRAGTYYLWNVCEGSRYQFSTCGAGFDSRITVYRDDNGDLVGFNDDNGPACAGIESSVNITAPYTGLLRVLVDEGNCLSSNSNAPLSGNAIGGPLNDVCSGATAMNVGDSRTGNTCCAQPDVAPVCGTTDGTGGGLWFSFLGNGSEVRAQLCNAGFDTRIRVYTGACGALTCVDGTDNGGVCGGLLSSVDFCTNNGQTYYILVHGTAADCGSFTLDLVDLGNTVACPTVYQMARPVIPCTQTTFDLCLSTGASVANGLWGIGYCLEYDTNAFRPTGNFTLGPVATNAVGYSAILDTFTPGRVFTGVYLAGTTVNYLTGSGDVICLEFELINTDPDTHSFPVCNLTESYDPQVSGLGSVFSSVSTGQVIVQRVDSIGGQSIYRDDPLRPVGNRAGAPLLSVFPTQEVGGVCVFVGAGTLPDSTGQIAIGNVGANTNAVSLIRDIPNTNPVLNVINAADANRVFQIWAGSYPNPDIFELISADTDGDGSIQIGDMSAINARSVLARGDFFGLPDWHYVNDSLLASIAYVNAGRNNVPRPPDCLPLYQDSTTSCVSANRTEVFHAILVGDVDGNWSTADMSILKTAGDAWFEVRLEEIQTLGAGEYRIPVYGFAPDPVNGLDLDLDYETGTWEILSVTPSEEFEDQSRFFTWNAYQNERLLITGGLTNGWASNQPILYLEVESSTVPSEADLVAMHGYMEGEPVEVYGKQHEEVDEAAPNLGNELTVYPNPNKGQFVIRMKGCEGEQVAAELLNAMGQRVAEVALDGEYTRVEWGGLPAGVYTLKVEGHSVKRVVIR